MDSQPSRPHGHNYDEQGLPSVIEGEDEHHHEKKSVLNKVKAKAKKIKETLKKHGHGHGHDHDHDYHSHDHSTEEEEDDEEEEMVEDPEVLGAPMYESAAVRSAVAGVNLEKPTVVAEDRYESKFTDPPTRPFAQRQGENSGQPGSNVGSLSTTVAPGVPFSTGTCCTKGSELDWNFVHGKEENMGQSKITTMGTQTAMEEDPNSPKVQPEVSNYQSKVTDPTAAGGEEVGITPILRSFDKMSVYDEPKPKSEGSPKLYSGSHDQFSPEPLPADAIPNPGSALKSFDPSKPEDMPRDTFTKHTSSDQTGYTEKISSATRPITTIADKAVAAKNVVATKTGSAAEYGHKIATTVYEKVADVGSSVMSKVQGTRTGQERGGDIVPDKGVSVKEYLAEKLRPGDEDRALSELISEALHMRKQEAEEKQVGTVTESEEVARQLGTGSDGREGSDSPQAVTDVSGGGGGKAVVERLKGTMSSWFTKRGSIDMSQTTQASVGTTHGDHDRVASSASEEEVHGGGQDGVGEQRLQE